MTDPAVGASACASGSHIWKGIMGILTAKLAKKANQSKICVLVSKLTFHKICISVVPC